LGDVYDLNPKEVNGVLWYASGGKMNTKFVEIILSHAIFV
jgi:hypothetical protein